VTSAPGRPSWGDGRSRVHAGHDGGRTLDVPSVVTLEHGAGPIEPGVDHRLCPDAQTLSRRRR
jgi:hypothetical protein